MKEIKTPISVYKLEILRIMRQFWKSENVEMWCKSLYIYQILYGK